MDAKKMGGNILKLPEELVLNILTCSEMDCKTLLHFGQTCKKFNNIVQDPILWKRRLQTRYPKIYESVILHGNDDYFEQYRYVKNTEKTVLAELKLMSSKYFWHPRDLTVEDARPFFYLCKERNVSLVCVHSILVDIIQKSGQIIESDKPSQSPYTLTVQYYASHVIRFLVHSFLMFHWQSMKLAFKQITMERTLNLYANWISVTEISEYSDLKVLLDNLAEDVIQELPLSHPIHSIPAENRAEWAQDLLIDNMWGLEHNLAVQTAIKDVIYIKRAMKIDTNLSYKSIHIPLILKKNKGHIMALAVIYEAVARRCGLRCELVAFPNHFFLDWSESYIHRSPQFRVNLTNGKMEKTRVCPFGTNTNASSKEYAPEKLIDSLTEEFRRVLKTERVVSMILKVEGIDDMVHGDEMHHGGRYYDRFNMMANFTDITQILYERPDTHFYNLDPDYRYLYAEFSEPQADYHPGHAITKRTVYRNRRTSNVSLAVGMVCEHLMYNYTCVVTGWDPVCAAPADWMTRMGVDALVYKAQQPFYNVYATDGTTRYVAQENLKILMNCRPKIVEEVIGKEFSHFNGTYYIPNEEKQKEYPDEQQVIAAYRRAPTLLMSTCKLMKPVPGHMQYFNWR